MIAEQDAATSAATLPASPDTPPPVTLSFVNNTVVAVMLLGAAALALQGYARSPHAAAPPAQVAAVDQLGFRIALLERRLDTAPPDGGQLGATIVLLALQEMRRKLDAGQPFAVEAAAFRRVAPGLAREDVFARAERHAERGVPTVPALRREFAQLRPMVERQISAAGGIAGRVARGWQDVLLTLSLADPQPPSAAQALLQLDEALVAGDARAALAAGQHMAGEGAALVDPWLTALRARVEAERDFDTLQTAGWRSLAAQ